MRLQRGDCAGLLAPSGFVTNDVLEASVAFLQGLGLRVKVGESCFCRLGYLAGADDVRARDFNRMTADEDVAGLFALRGGYGAARILPLIDWDVFREADKPFFGYSDSTAVHLAIQLLGLRSFHTPMPATELRRGADAFTLASYEACVFGGGYDLRNPPGHTMTALSGGVCEGVLTGGNLSMLAASLGTPFALDVRGAVLFLEEISEEPYRIDRMLTQLAQAGVFRDCAGVVLGAFTDCAANRPDASLNCAEVLADAFTGLGKPVLSGLACGHCLPTLSLPLGVKVRLDTNRMELTVLEG